MIIRPERPGDVGAVQRVTASAFRGAPHSTQTEPAIVAALRAAGALSLSLVAEDGGDVVGHVAFSPVRIAGQDGAWFGLGPVSVEPVRQGQGIGQALIRAGLADLRALGAAGCVVLGDPGYYARFGFASDPGLTYADAPLGYFRYLAFGKVKPVGEVAYHPAFAAR